MHKLSIDSREPKKVQKAVISQMPRDVETEVKTLEVGDYIWDDEIVIERKTIGDFIWSVRDSRVFTQCQDMDQYQSSYLVIVGSFDKIRFDPRLRGFGVDHRIGSMARIYASTKARILTVDNMNQFAKALDSIRRKENGLDKTLVVERHSKTINRHNPNLSMYLTIPGVGIATATKLVDLYPRFEDFLIRSPWEEGELRLNKVAREFLSHIKSPTDHK